MAPQLQDDVSAAATLAEILSCGPNDYEDVDELVLPFELGKFTLETKLGEGAMARVYRARHRSLNTLRAIKILRAQYTKDQHVLRRFVSEGRVLSRIRHENLVHVFDLCEPSADLPGYLVMEFLEGETLEKRLADAGGLPLDVVMSFAMQLASALIVVHDSGVAHRDIKPSNIFIMRMPNGEERVKLLDFGIAKGLGDTSLHGTRPGTLVGTPAYMAPEQVLGEPVDHRVDIYQFGLVMCEMLKGTSPCEAETLLDVLMWHTTEHETVLPPTVPEAVAQVIRHCIEIDRERRFGSMRLLHRHLVDATTGPQQTIVQPAAVMSTPFCEPQAIERPRRGALYFTTFLAAIALLFFASIVVDSTVESAEVRVGSYVPPPTSPLPSFRNTRYVSRAIQDPAVKPTAKPSAPPVEEPQHDYVPRSTTKSPF